VEVEDLKRVVAESAHKKAPTIQVGVEVINAAVHVGQGNGL